jgi:hypothetical protein
MQSSLNAESCHVLIDWNHYDSPNMSSQADEGSGSAVFCGRKRLLSGGQWILHYQSD